jgi:membrane fusion protein (multidrug efflux system)
VLALLALSLACRPVQPEPAAKARLSGFEEPTVDVQTVRLRRGSVVQRVTAPGSVVARRESRIGPEISGRIVRVHVAAGDRVEEGAPLFDIDRTPFEMALRQAEAGAEVARSERQQIEAELGRAAALHRENVLSQQELERLRTRLAVALAHERQAAEAVALARLNLGRTRVVAPYAGSVAERLADEGTTALAQPQTIVVVLQETRILEARAAIPESQLALVRVGDSARVTIEGLGAPILSEVSAVADTIDPATRTYLVKILVPNPSHAIKAGVFAQVEIEPGQREQALLAPRESIRVEDGRARLLAVRDGRVALVPIEVGAVSASEAEIVAGAAAGELVIVGETARTIADGMRVRGQTLARGETP